MRLLERLKNCFTSQLFMLALVLQQMGKNFAVLNIWFMPADCLLSLSGDKSQKAGEEVQQFLEGWSWVWQIGTYISVFLKHKSDYFRALSSFLSEAALRIPKTYRKWTKQEWSLWEFTVKDKLPWVPRTAADFWAPFLLAHAILIAKLAH